MKTFALLLVLVANAASTKKTEVLNTVVESDGEVIPEVTVVDMADGLTQRHNTISNIMEDFNTGYEAVRHTAGDADTVCVVQSIEGGGGAGSQAAEEKEVKEAVGTVRSVEWSEKVMEPADELRETAGDKINKFCGDLPLVKLTEPKTKRRFRSRRGWRRVWHTVKGVAGVITTVAPYLGKK